MKTYILILWLAILQSLALFANDDTLEDPKPEKIYSFAQILHSLEYYEEQTQLWQLETEKNQRNADAWLNYYLAARIVNILGEDKKAFDLDAIIKEVKKTIPEDSFEYNYLIYKHSGGDPDLYAHIEKAYALAPDRPETYSGLITYHETNRNQEMVQKISRQWYDSKEFSPGILAWNYNVLMSLEPNAVVFTYGDNDTYPLWLLQHGKGLRQDVTVINTHLILRAGYFSAILKELSLPDFTKQNEDFKTSLEYQLAIIQHLIDHADQPIYMGIATPKNMRNEYSDNLYLVGLALKYAPTNFDNIVQLKDNFENKFLTDHLKVDFETDKSRSVLRQLNLNYLPALLVLHKYYLEANELNKVDEIVQLCQNIASEGGRLTQTNYYLQQQVAEFQDIESILEIKTLEDGLQKVAPRLYAMEGEVNNLQYEQFLMDLLKNKAFDLLETCKTTKTDWRSLLPIYHQLVPNKTVFLHGHPDSDENPVQNISYEAAQLYCTWITNVYNSSNSKKKNFQKVKFRLPTEEEWEKAGRAGHDQAPYPWGGFYSRNAKGCYLANFYVSEELPCETCDNTHPSNDGGFFSVKITSYFPNDYGLYNISGNIAEMIAEKGIAKGGSWEDTPENCVIHSRKEYNGISPAIGFRVFMEVVE